MRMTFALKLGLLITLLTLTLMASTLSYLYKHTEGVIFSEMEGRLSDLAHIGTYLFREEDRELVGLFRDELFDELGTIPASNLAIPSGLSCPNLPRETQELFHDSYPFQYLVQLLRQVQFGTSREVRSLQWLEPVLGGLKDDEPQVQWAYLMVRNDQLKENDLVVFLADSYYEAPEDAEHAREEQELADEPVPEWCPRLEEVQELAHSNPIGTLYAGQSELFQKPFDDGEIAVSDGFIEDDWGQVMSAVVPIKDHDGEVIATLGLDYSVENRAVALQRLKYFSISLFGGALVLALFASFALAGIINLPISRLRAGAERFGKRDFNKPIRVRSKDEFGLLAKTLNTMASEIRDYSEGMEELVAERTSELEKASQEILQLNEKLRQEKDSLGAEVDIAKGLQQLVLPGPEDFAQLQELSIEAWMNPAQLVGGDYFDVLAINPNQAWLAIGDVTGHGLESGVTMLMMRTAIRTILGARSDAEPEQQYDLINRLAFEDFHRLQGDKHMTLSLLRYVGGGAFDVTGQHQDLLVIRDEGVVETLDTTGLGLPLGLVEDISAFTNRLRVRLRVGQTLVLHSNGITDAENTTGEPYGLDRMIEVLRAQARATPADIRKAIIDDVQAYTGDQWIRDDMTLLIVRREK